MTPAIAPPPNKASIDSWLGWMEAMHPNEIELGLQRVGEVARRLGLFECENPPKVVTVAGTNGKGTCVATVEAILTSAGYSVGTYTSPHLIQYNERIRSNATNISDSDLLKSFQRVYEALGGCALTYFEFGTLAALDYLYKSSLNVVVLEVGLGGRLDAVNIIDPDVAVVVTVDLDHQAWLGNSRESIGFEKAGIFRKGSIAIVGESQAPNSVIEQSDKKGCYRLQRDRDFTLNDDESLFEGIQLSQNSIKETDVLNVDGKDLAPIQIKMPISGYYSVDSLAVGVQAVLALSLPLSVEEIEKGLNQLILPGRFDQFILKGVHYVLDVAHNPQASRNLSRQLQAYIKSHQIERVIAIAGVLDDKAIGEMLEPLMSIVDEWNFVGLNSSRSASSNELQTILRTLYHTDAGEYKDFGACYQVVVDTLVAGDCVLVFGSFLTVADAMGTLAV